LYRQALQFKPFHFSPFNAQATLFMKSAFWSLLLPISVHGRVSDIWRSYIAQRLLWEYESSISFLPPMVIQHRNAHEYLADMQAETDLYFKTNALISFLESWKPKGTSFEKKLLKLFVELYERLHCHSRHISRERMD
jgi:hypothetical protein